jgi:1-acyl-sn-glycerol-3-phosphate acyltransferase
LGIGALVAGRDVAVLPCYLQGAFRAWPKGRRLPRPRKVRLIVGGPRNYSSRNTNKIDMCTIAAELHRAVKKLGECNGSD